MSDQAGLPGKENARQSRIALVDENKGGQAAHSAPDIVPKKFPWQTGTSSMSQ
jgi:hypothetical protein